MSGFNVNVNFMRMFDINIPDIVSSGYGIATCRY